VVKVIRPLLMNADSNAQPAADSSNTSDGQIEDEKDRGLDYAASLRTLFRKPLRWGVLVSAKTWIAKLGVVKFTFTLSSLLYCAVHWFVAQDVSIFVFSGALVFGAVSATAVALVLFLFTGIQSPSTRHSVLTLYRRIRS
jgi:hypothetical protein